MMRNTESLSNIVIVTFAVCLVCAILVASVSIVLRDKQAANAALSQQRNVLAVLGIIPKDDQAVREAFADLTVKVVNLETDQYAREVEPADADIKKQLRDPRTFSLLDQAQDIAGIKRLEKYTLIYLLEKDGNMQKIVLPIRGYGLWSTLYGYIALESDFNTVSGISFYQHAETPGLGGEVDNKKWRQQWLGKKVYDQSGAVAFTLVKSGIGNDNLHTVDALSGASLTSRGVRNLIHFWFGKDGFGDFIKNLKNVS